MASNKQDDLWGTRPPRAKTYTLPKARRERLHARWLDARPAVYAKCGLTPGNVPRDMSRGITVNTSAAYKKHRDGLASFFQLRGDYDSLLILDPLAPPSVPSMQETSLMEYLDYKTKPAGTPMIDPMGTPLISVDDKPVTRFAN